MNSIAEWEYVNSMKPSIIEQLEFSSRGKREETRYGPVRCVDIVCYLRICTRESDRMALSSRIDLHPSYTMFQSNQIA